MGLDTSHNAWHGAYSAFNRFRTEIAHLAGFPPLELMEGYWGTNDNPFTLLDYKYPIGNELEYSNIRRLKERLPIKWDVFEKHDLIVLLTHSDCDGDINPGECKRIANGLEKLLPLMDGKDLGGHIGNLQEKTKQFIKGCREAHAKKEKLTFG